MSPIAFTVTPIVINTRLIIRLPKEISAQLPSRGQVMVTGSINGISLTTPLEPDGTWSHWFMINDELRDAAGLSADKPAELIIEVTKDWTEPPIPSDLKKAVAASPVATDLWPTITPMARWEWVRWIRSTGSDETRARRIAVAVSKLESGKRRPCCWNRNLSTEPAVSKNGVLLEPVHV